MAGPGEFDRRNFDLFRSLGLDFLNDELTGVDYFTEQTEGGLVTVAEQTEQTEKTESEQLNDEDIDNFLDENRIKNATKRCKATLTRFTVGQQLLTKQEILKTYENKNLPNFYPTFFLVFARKTEMNTNALTSMLRSFDRSR